ncbi:nucleolin-like isoform X2 [Hylaeus volcanicus]|uniref:nucleolin-like isoform X2 n=1 Tax=Hylaeus volcanicus TaxID=313075 RepID=UPI0023B7F0EA|nr:nucleolin-like isoform X2 [Hylaeus volcanicus]
MFFGAVLKPGTSFTPEVIDGEILHISQACLYNPANVERTYLEVVDDDETYAACVLQKEKQESVSLDLYLNGSNGSKLQISGGRNEVHIVGYYEPQDGSDSEDISVSEPDGYDFDNDDSSSENVNSNRCKPISSSKADKGADDEDDEDDDDEDDDDEEDDEEDDDENDDDDDENAESDAASDEQMSGKQNELKQNSKTKEARPESNKRHSNSTVSKPSKMAKRERGKMSPEAEFEKQIVDYLKSSGRVMISQLAGKIRKPDSLKTMRYQAFLKSKPSFKVDGQYVSLKS